MVTPYLGMIKLFPYTFIPMDWKECDGSTLNITQYSALYSLLGIQFGGDGRTTFKIPDLRNALPYPGAQGQKAYVYCIAMTGYYPERP